VARALTACVRPIIVRAHVRVPQRFRHLPGDY
jgi:hypothetical protein